MLSISSARFPEDSGTVARLFLGYLDFLFERAAEERENIQQKYHPDKIDTLVAEFARIHARPHGDILIARKAEDPVGIGMMREMEPGIAEIQRVFVADAARGTGAGKALTLALMDRVRADGHKLVRLDTGRALKEAIGLYEHLGFRACPPLPQPNPVSRSSDHAF